MIFVEEEVVGEVEDAVDGPELEGEEEGEEGKRVFLKCVHISASLDPLLWNTLTQGDQVVQGMHTEEFASNSIFAMKSP